MDKLGNSFGNIVRQVIVEKIYYQKERSTEEVILENFGRFIYDFTYKDIQSYVRDRMFIPFMEIRFWKNRFGINNK